MKNILAILIIALIVAAIAVPFVYAIAQGVAEKATHTACLQKGWRDSDVTWNFKRFCVTRNDQTDIVKPLNEIN